MIYLASPYTSNAKSVRLLRYIQVSAIAGELLRQGMPVISPIVHWHPLVEKLDLPTSFDFWMEYDYKLIRACDSVLVACMDGWEVSRGVNAEMTFAKEIQKPVRYLRPSDLEITDEPILSSSTNSLLL